MRKLLLLGLLLCPFLSIGQITYTSSDFVEIGDTARYSIALIAIDSFNVDTTGANFHWNFANLPVNSQVVEEYLSPETPGYKNSWCVASGNLTNCQSAFDNLTNLAIIASDSLSLGGFTVNDIARHYNKESDSYAETMIGVTALSIPFAFEYEKKDTVLRFPLTFGQEDSTESKLVIDLNSLGIDVVQTSTQKRKNKVDGWGSLTTPLQHYPNVLRMRTEIDRLDITALDTGDIVIDTMLVEYRWFASGESFPVMEATGVIVNGQENINRIRYLDIFRCLTPTSTFAFQPLLPIYDAVTRSATVNFTNLSTNADGFTWNFGDGQSSSEANPSHAYLCEGNYFVELISSNSCNTAITDTFMLPIFINDTTTFVPDTLSRSICSGDSLLINGSFESTPGFYVDSISSVNGCDSAVIINLGILDVANPDTVQQAICFGDSIMINNEFVSSAGFYPDSLTAQNNCDSVIVVELSVTSVDNTVTMTTDTLTANQLNATYQWIDCSTNTDISGATSRIFTPSGDGSYAVRVEMDGCSVQSDCISFTISALIGDPIQPDLKVFPNPFTNQFLIQAGKNKRFNQLKLFTASGSLIGTTSMNPTTEFQLDFAPQRGIYLLQIYFVDGSVNTVKLVKE